MELNWLIILTISIIMQIVNNLKYAYKLFNINSVGHEEQAIFCYINFAEDLFEKESYYSSADQIAVAYVKIDQSKDRICTLLNYLQDFANFMSRKKFILENPNVESINWKSLSKDLEKLERMHTDKNGRQGPPDLSGDLFTSLDRLN